MSPSGSSGLSTSDVRRRRRRPRPESISRLPDSHDEAPEWILDEILDLLESRTGVASNGCDNRCSTKSERGNFADDDNGGWVLQEISEAKSAQQQVYILKFVESQSYNMHCINNEWDNALRLGHNRLVLRIWRGGSRWWNLNRNESPLELARSEISGYKIARKAFETCRAERNDKSNTDPYTSIKAGARMMPKIPRVLHFHVPPAPDESTVVEPPPQTTGTSNSLCWAVLEYVGADETDRLATATDQHQAQTGDDSCDETRKVFVDRSYLEGMITIRKEFGFDEPHPRWGRVPVEKVLDYAQLILREVLLPLHNHLGREDCDSLAPDEDVKTFLGMVQVYQKAWNDVANTLPDLQHPNQTTESRLEECLRKLEEGVAALNRFATVDGIPCLDPVLLHLDLQPQNLIFRKPSDSAQAGGCNMQSQSQAQQHDLVWKEQQQPSVFSVLDWEDAAWGDPRFDLVLLCRKVCANKGQADAIWSEYARTIAATTAPCENSDEPPPPPDRLGPIEPWLLLETVHSIATMLLQSTDLLNGGRNPWETKKDLWGKLQREFLRLKGYETLELCED